MVGFTEEVEDAYERLLASLEGADDAGLYPVLRSLASLYSFRSENQKAADLGRRMLRIAEERGDPRFAVEGRLALGPALSFTGRVGDGIPEVEAAIAWFAANPGHPRWLRLGPDPLVACLTAAGMLLWWQGRVERSLDRSHQAVARAREIDHASTSGYALFHAALLRLWRGEPEEARDLAVRTVEVADEHDLRIWRAVGTVVLGAATTELAPGDEGLRWVDEGLARYRDLRTPPVFWPFLLQVKATACLRASRIVQGLAAADQGLTMYEGLPDLHLVRGDLLLQAGSAGEAVAAWERAHRSARAWGAGTPALRAAIRLCRVEGVADPAVRRTRLTDLREAVEGLTEGQGSPDLREAWVLLEAGG
jgi:tetratricopeptide (TPR) repeat protein